jgi:hypothetical protein
MIDPRTASVIAAITARYPGTRIEVRPNPDPATTAAIPDFLIVLDAPPDRLHEVASFGTDVAFAAFGDDQVPFFVDAFDMCRTAVSCRPEAVGGDSTR